MKPVSIIIPVYNGASFVTQALDCASQQAPANSEIIVIDDGSSDGSADIARAHRADPHVISQSNQGPGAARNRGIEIASRSYVAFLDVDDLWPEGKLQRQMKLLEKSPELDLVLGLIQHQVLPGGTHFDMQFEDEEASTLPFFHFGAGLYRRRCFEAVGLIDEALSDSEDHDWFIRFKEAGLNWVVESAIGLIYRRHTTNMTQPAPLNKTEIFRVLALSLARRRSGSACDDVAPLEKLTDRRMTDSGKERTK